MGWIRNPNKYSENKSSSNSHKGTDTCNITINTQKLDVDKYKYLESFITTGGKCDNEIICRIAIAKDTFWKHKEFLRKKFWILIYFHHYHIHVKRGL